MANITGIIIYFIVLTVPVIIVGILIYLIINSMKNKETKFKLTSKLLLQLYLYIVSLLTLAIAVIGGAVAIQAGLSFKFGVPFSYTLYAANKYEDELAYNPTLTRDDFNECATGESILNINGNNYCFDTQRQITDLVNGITIFFSMLMLFGIHQFALSRIKKTDRIDWLYKLYIFISLILYSIASLISIPIAIYQTANFFLISSNQDVYYTPAAPASTIAVVLLSIPLWLFFLRKTIQLKEE